MLKGISKGSWWILRYCIMKGPSLDPKGIVPQVYGTLARHLLSWKVKQRILKFFHEETSSILYCRSRYNCCAAWAAPHIRKLEPHTKTILKRPPQPLQRRNNYHGFECTVLYGNTKSSGAPCKAPRGPIWAPCKAPNSKDSVVLFVWYLFIGKYVFHKTQYSTLFFHETTFNVLDLTLSLEGLPSGFLEEILREL